jgi:hypothetical protein
MKNITNFNQFFESYLKNDASGYDIGDYVYHVTPIENLNHIKQNGFIPKDGTSINNEKFENRLYFATSLIAAYDLSVNFGSYKYDSDFIIFKINSYCINDYEIDDLFEHGIYVDYAIKYNCVIDVFYASDLFGKFDDNDLENLYI